MIKFTLFFGPALFLSLLIILVSRSCSLLNDLPFVKNRITDSNGVVYRDVKLIVATNNRMSNFEARLVGFDSLLANIYGKKLFSYSGFQMTLFIAVIYPVILSLLIWVFGGGDRIGFLMVVPIIAAPWRLAIMAIVSLYFCSIWFMFLPRTQQKIFDFLGSIFAPIASHVKIGHDVFATVVFVIALIFIFTSTHVFASVGPLVIAFAVGFSGIVAAVVAFASVESVASAGAGTIAVVSATVVAGFVVVVGSGDFAAPAAVTVAIIVDAVIEAIARKSSLYSNWRKEVVYVTLQLLIIITLIVLVSLLPLLWSKNVSAYATTDRFAPFALLFFMGILPVVNTTFGYCSVCISRYFVKLFSREDNWRYCIIVVDLITAVVMVLAFYWLIIEILGSLRHVGWGINIQTVRNLFAYDPRGCRIAWITLLAVANISPILLQFLLIFWGWFSCLLYDGRAIRKCVDDLEKPPFGQLQDCDAHWLERFLWIDRYMKPAFIVSLLWLSVWPFSLLARWFFL